MNSKSRYKLLVICGPTSTGKTDLGIYLAKKFSTKSGPDSVWNSEIISADSRQVYKSMDIGTGKDIKNYELRMMNNAREEYYETESGIKIWGYDLVLPTEEFSVSHFEKYVKDKIKDISSRGKLPILVGGTGLYIKGVLFGFETAVVKPDYKLREELANKNKDELYRELLLLDKNKALSLNESDKKNPRRLIRAIEVSKSNEKTEHLKNNYDVLQIGLTSSLEFLDRRVKQSVLRRLENGMVGEVRELLSLGVGVNEKSMSATGYLQIVSYIKGEISKESAISEWEKAERQYVKRQLTWFKKQPDINWFDISDHNYKRKVEELVRSWDNGVSL